MKNFKKALVVTGILIFILSLSLSVFGQELEISDVEAGFAIDGIDSTWDESEFGKVLLTAKGRTIIPVRIISEKLGFEVVWDGEKQLVKIIGSGKEIDLPINSDIVVVNNDTVKLDVPATILNGRTYVPARFIAEALGYEVQWLPENEINKRWGTKKQNYVNVLTMETIEVPKMDERLKRKFEIFEMLEESFFTQEPIKFNESDDPNFLNELRETYSLFFYNYMEYLPYIEGLKTKKITNGKTGEVKYESTVIIRDNLTLEQIKEELEFNDFWIKKIADDLRKENKVNETMSEKEIVKAVYNWVTSNVRYTDYKYEQAYISIYSAIKIKETTCVGFTGLYNSLLNEFGIKAETIVGEVDSELHSWSKIILKDEIFYSDATFGVNEWEKYFDFEPIIHIQTIFQ